jgi:hypothetical protein
MLDDAAAGEGASIVVGGAVAFGAKIDKAPYALS